MTAIIPPLNGLILTKEMLKSHIDFNSRLITTDMPELEEEDIPLISFQLPFDPNDPIRPVLYKNNTLLVAGMPKARKSFFVQMLTAAFFTKNPAVTGGFFYTGTEKPFGIKFDTEMDRREVYKRHKSLCTKWVTDSLIEDDIKTYYLRGLTVQGKIETIEAVLDHWHDQGKKITFAVIDQIMDLTSGGDTFEEASRLVLKIQEWNEKYGVSFIITMHTNRAGKATYGHTGATFDKKAEGVLLVSIDENTGISKVKPSLGRFNGDPWEIEFAQDGAVPVVKDIKSIVRDFSSQSFVNRFGNVGSNDVSLQQQGADDDFPF